MTQNQLATLGTSIYFWDILEEKISTECCKWWHPRNTVRKLNRQNIYRVNFYHVYFLGISVIPAVLQLLLLPLCPESPRYLLISKQQESLAREGNQA